MGKGGGGGSSAGWLLPHRSIWTPHFAGWPDENGLMMPAQRGSWAMPRANDGSQITRDRLRVAVTLADLVFCSLWEDALAVPTHAAAAKRRRETLGREKGRVPRRVGPDGQTET